VAIPFPVNMAAVPFLVKMAAIMIFGQNGGTSGSAQNGDRPNDDTSGQEGITLYHDFGPPVLRQMGLLLFFLFSFLFFLSFFSSFQTLFIYTHEPEERLRPRHKASQSWFSNQLNQRS
jgi:hypothetical protein